MSQSKPHLLFMLSASVAAYKACQLISNLLHEGYDVQCVVTPSTSHFIGAATLEGLTGRKVLGDLWEPGRAMDHIHLARWADSALLCPASANLLARMAHGLADDLPSTLALAWESHKPFWIAPAMNHQMLQNPATQNNLQTLQARGFRILPTGSGSLACGEEGYGRLLEPDEILRWIRKPKLGQVLVTGGATREPIDGIRFISNVSTGQTAATLCDQFSDLGYDVTFLHGTGSQLPQTTTRNLPFTSFGDLDEKLREQLQSTDFVAVVHSAAVSDFSVEDAQPDSKLSSRAELTLRLRPNFKILPRLKEYSRNRQITVVGFKLTLNSDPVARALESLSDSVDAVVANEWGHVQRDRSRHPGTLVTREGERLDFLDLKSLSQLLHSRIEKGIENGSGT
jgi:phosphopantothenoylcysteine decarboxylase/phosphopantothenate--cysteine ligase